MLDVLVSPVLLQRALLVGISAIVLERLVQLVLLGQVQLHVRLGGLVASAVSVFSCDASCARFSSNHSPLGRQ